MSETIAPETLLVRTKEILESEVGGEIVALDIEKGQCYGLNSVGSAIWRILEVETSFASLCDALVAEYEIDRTRCESEVRSLLQELHEEGLIVCR